MHGCLSSSSASRFEREREEDGVGLERVRVVGQVLVICGGEEEEEGVLGYYDVVPLLLLHFLSLDQNS